MAKRTDVKKILIIGSGPIVIGQAAEFDYAGTQACLALKEEGYEVVLCNSNPATIMTDTIIADKVYMEPLTLEYIAKIIRYERPDAIIPGIGGQTGLNLAMQLEQKGILKECRVKLLGTPSSSIERAEDRELFRETMRRIGQPVVPSGIANDCETALQVAREIGYPVIVRPAFTLGGTGGGIAADEAELKACADKLAEQKPVVQQYVMDQIFDAMENEEAWIAPYYAGDYLTMAEENPDLAFYQPEEQGFNLFIDAMCIPTCCQEKEAAELFINFLCDPEISAANMDFLGYSTPSTAAKELMDPEIAGSEVAYPSADTLRAASSFDFLPEETSRYMESLFMEVRNG